MGDGLLSVSSERYPLLRFSKKAPFSLSSELHSRLSDSLLILSGFVSIPVTRNLAEDTLTDSGNPT